MQDLSLAIFLLKRIFLKAETILVAFITITNELSRLSAVESAMVFHAVKHSHSYISQACTINMIRKSFQDSSTAKNITRDKTKVRTRYLN